MEKKAFLVTDPARIHREKKTVRTMIQMYCAAHHNSKLQLCPTCLGLQKYAFQRLDLCPFRENKSTCAKCPVHCYTRSMRTQIQGIMRYSAPRMLFKHPILALRHVLDGLTAS
jgi:hypothetical protein